MSSSVIRRLNAIEDLPTIPHTMQQVLSQIDELSSSVGTLQSIIEQDPAITSMLLRAANSTFYSPQEEISSVGRAIVMMGFREIRNRVISYSLMGFFSDDLGFDEFKPVDLWLHSIGVAVAARKIAQKVKGLDPDEMFTAGMLHDIGRLIYCLYLKQELREVLRVAKESGCSLNEAEEKVGLTHGEIGSYIAMRWKLSALLVDVIQHHHKPQNAGVNLKAASAVFLADSLAIRLGIGWSGIGGPCRILVPKNLGLDGDTVRGIALQLKEEKQKIIAGWGNVIGEG
ncbi:MAG: HDOD domain-containing protein [Desulfobulbaceae bacterium]|nr:HDOD domain-containing protein [Desulfobulbaceae bacterium]